MKIETYCLTASTSAHWPSCLSQIPSAPTQIFAQGKPQALSLLEQLPDRGLAIVGTRRPQTRNELLSRNLVQALKNTDLIIISGLALGIDAAAHEGALRAGRPTIAILGTSLDNIYPPENSALLGQILDAGGLVLSETPPDAPVRKSNFLTRNRLIAALSRAVCIIEAPLPSGAMNTAAWARKFDRSVFAVPCHPGDALTLGNQRLLSRDGAFALWSAQDLGQEWKEYSTHLKAPKRPKTELPLFQNAVTAPSDSSVLTQVVTEAWKLHRWVDISTLLTWSEREGWNRTRLFGALRSAVEQKELKEMNGLWVPS